MHFEERVRRVLRFGRSVRCRATELMDVTLGTCVDMKEKGAQKSSVKTGKEGSKWQGRKTGPCGVTEVKQGNASSMEWSIHDHRVWKASGEEPGVQEERSL